MSLKLLLVFACTEFLMSLSPGPAVLLVVSQGMRGGFKPSLRGTAGILSGNVIYFGLSALGLGALLMASARLFTVVQWLGVAYLIFTGLGMLFASGEPKLNRPFEEQANSRRRGSLQFYSQGLITQLSNPKAIVFFTALLPQFVTPGRGMLLQFVTL